MSACWSTSSFLRWLGALLFRGGLAIHILGIAVVGRDGRPSRLRSLRRAVIAWLPFLLSPMSGAGGEQCCRAQTMRLARGGHCPGTCNPALALVAPQLAGPRCLHLPGAKRGVGRHRTCREQPEPKMAAAAGCRRRGCLGGFARVGCPVCGPCAERCEKCRKQAQLLPWRAAP